MKLTTILLLAACMQLSAAGFSQPITVSGQDIPLKKLFQTIQRQSGYSFLYFDRDIAKAKKVTIDVHDWPLQQVLDQVFLDQPLNYTIIEKTVVVKEKPMNAETAPLPPPVDVKGRVLDENGQPLAGITVSVKGSSLAVATNANGEFLLKGMDASATLVLSGVNIESTELKLNGKTDLVLQVKTRVSRMDELIITGYSQRKISELTGSVQKLSGNELREGVSTTNALAMLKGKVAGFYINESGGGSVGNKGQVIMRGQASFIDAANTNFGPLIVVDGVITTAVNLQDIVNPNDIESITMLKDAASTAIYGSRAAQGVIVVTTRRGVKGQVRVDVNLKYGQTKDNRLVRFMTTQETVAHIQKSMEMMYSTTPSIRTQFPTFQAFYTATKPFSDADMTHYQNWDKVLYTDGHEKDINLALSSGTDKTKFYGAINWYREDGTLIDDKLDRKSLRLNIDQQINSKLSVGISTNAIVDNYTTSNSESQYYLFQPWVLPTYANGQLADSIPNYIFRATAAPSVQWYDNPVYSHSYNTNLRQIQSYLGTGYIKYNILPWLYAQSTNTIQFVNNNYNSYRDPRTFRGRWDGPASAPIFVNGEITVTDARTRYYLTSNQLHFNKALGAHQVRGLIGQEYGRTNIETISASAFNTAYPGERNLGAFKSYGSWLNLRPGATAAIPSSAASVDRASFSVFGEANYNYQDKYFASTSFRRDASTNFGKLHRYGNFYSFSGGWLVSKEGFFNVKPITNLKLRASYGTSGREAGADYLNFTTYTDNVRYNDPNTFGSTIQRLANDQITWETTYTTDLGLDLSLWKRIDLSVDWYRRRSANLIQGTYLPSYIGFASQTRNVGELVNKGVEITLSSQNIKTPDFEWITDFNISFNQNRLTKIYGDSLIDSWSNSFYRYKGEDINVLKAVYFAGVNPDNGRPLFERVMPDGKIQLVDSLPTVLADGIRSFRTVGSATPKFFGGFGNTFRYKGISLTALFNFVYGNKIMNQSVNNFLDPTSWRSGFALVNPDDAIRLWQEPGDKNANYPNFYDPAFSQRGSTSFRSSLIYQDASYLRLRNIRLGYELPASLIGKAKIRSANIYLSMDNVFVITSKELFAADPEGAKLGTSASYSGTGFSSAMPKRFVVGMNIGL